MQLQKKTFATSRQSSLAFPVGSFFPRKRRKSNFLILAGVKHAPQIYPKHDSKADEKENSKKLIISIKKNGRNMSTLTWRLSMKIPEV